MEFEWDEAKDASNLKKHGVRFAEAATIWGDDFSKEFYDPIHSVDEKRYIKIGRSVKRRILLCIFCERFIEENIRIISARKATKLEVIEYEK